MMETFPFSGINYIIACLKAKYKNSYFISC